MIPPSVVELVVVVVVDRVDTVGRIGTVVVVGRGGIIVTVGLGTVVIVVTVGYKGWLNQRIVQAVGYVIQVCLYYINSLNAI